VGGIDRSSGGFPEWQLCLRAASRRAAELTALASSDSSGARRSTARAGLQRALVRSYPNISIIDVRDVLASIRDVVANVTLGVTVVGAVTLIGGALILIGAVAMTKFQRLYDAAIYRTLGASTKLVATMVAAEYAILGTLAGVLGSWARWGCPGRWRPTSSIEWQPATVLLTGGVAAAAVLVCAVGVATSLDVLSARLATLRGE
jgi:putative ABC transport system permease protein